MKTLITAIAVSAVMLALVAGPATGAPINAPLSLSLGVNFPDQAFAKDIGGSTQVAANLSYALTPTARREGALYLYIDYTDGGKSGANENSVGGGVGFRTNTPIYGGLDLGAYGTSVSVPIDHRTLTSNTTGGGGRVYLGGNLSHSRRPTRMASATIVKPSGWVHAKLLYEIASWQR